LTNELHRSCLCTAIRLKWLTFLIFNIQEITMKKLFRFRRTALALSALTLGGLAHAGVITGTGVASIAPFPAPSSTQMAKTDAVRMTMSESGPGHVLVVPYFTVQAGQTTAIQLVNSDLINGKVAKLSFRGATNGDILLDFQLLLAPGDIWTGTLTQASDGTTQLTSNDKSCTYPRIPSDASVRFSTNRLNRALPAAVQAGQTREGYVEAIVMADIPSSLMYGPSKNARSALFTAIQPLNGAAPCTSSALDAALLTDINSEAVAAGLGFSTPTTGLFGTWSIVDAMKSVTYSGTATAFSAVNENGFKARGNFVIFPQTSDPVASVEKFTSDPLLIPGENNSPAPIQAMNFDLPDISTPYYLPASAVNSRRTRNALSTLLSAQNMHNQFVSDPKQSKKTDWVSTAPTKRFYVGFDYRKANSVAALIRPPAIAGLSEPLYFGTAASSTETSCSQQPISTYMNQEGREFLMSDRTTGRPRISFCGAVSVLSFSGPNSPSALSASLTVQNLLPFVEKGWASINTGNLATGLGLPLLGASFTRVPSPATLANPGSASSGVTLSHSFDR
jgi:hypothetical protein